jgi:hypothetical protein
MTEVDDARIRDDMVRTAPGAARPGVPLRTDEREA